MPLDPPLVRSLFLAAIDLPNPADRLDFLDRECGEEIELRRRLDELLAVLDRPADLTGATSTDGPTPSEAVEKTASFLPDQPPDPSPMSGLIAGRYKIRQEIGEGGMGSVYLAEQLQPVKRQVAIKLIKPGMDSKMVLGRFESERQALALMDHPHIAKVFDAGTTEAGRPFFVMELVKGVPLTNYCDQHRLGLAERLALFRQICSAVQHAHQKGIIHRDLKPRNILVEDHDGKPVPKVIDFGLAKATSGMQLSENSLFTAFGTVAGTPMYMAPEQASLNALDVDTRADIYSLGVILYELLTGSTPISREAFQKAGLDEMLRVIREVDPPTPSSRLSSFEMLPSIAACRHTEPARLRRFVRGDLDWIVMKALAKERQRRYDSAIGLAVDIERFINHEPVSAGPPSSLYRLRKFVLRNRPQVVAGSFVMLALLGGIIGTTLGLFEAKKQAKIAEDRLGQRDRANKILLSVFHNLTSRHQAKTSLPLANLLGKQLEVAAAELEGEAIGDPTGVARMQMELGHALQELGYPQKAIILLTKALATLTERLGPDSSETLGCMTWLATAYKDAADFKRALPLFEKALGLARTKYGPDQIETISVQANLGACYYASGQSDRSMPLFEQTLDLMRKNFGPNDPRVLSTMTNLAESYRDAGQFAKSLPLLEQSLAIQKTILEPDEESLLTTMNNLALAYRFTGQEARAVPIHEKVLALSRKKLGSDHPTTLTRMGNLAEIYRLTGRAEQAVPLFEETHKLMKARLGPNHPYSLISQGGMANVYRDVGLGERTLPIYEDIYARAKSALGPDHRFTLDTMLDIADINLSDGRTDRALELAREVCDRRRPKDGRPSPDYTSALALLGRILLARQAWVEAEPPLREAVDIRGVQQPGDWRTFNSRSMLGGSLLGQRRFVEAEPLLRAGFEGMKQRIQNIPPQSRSRFVESIDRLIELAEATGKPDEAKAWRDEKAKLGGSSPPKPDEGEK